MSPVLESNQIEVILFDYKFLGKVDTLNSVLLISTQEAKRQCKSYSWCIAILSIRGIQDIILYSSMLVHS